MGLFRRKSKPEETKATNVRPKKCYRSRYVDSSSLKLGMVIVYNGKKYLLTGISSLARGKGRPYDVLTLVDIMYEGKFVTVSKENGVEFHGREVVSIQLGTQVEVLNYTEFKLNRMQDAIDEDSTSIIRKKMQYLYNDPYEGYFFKDVQTMDIIPISAETAGEYFEDVVMPNDEVTVSFYADVPFWVEPK